MIQDPPKDAIRQRLLEKYGGQTGAESTSTPVDPPPTQTQPDGAEAIRQRLLDRYKDGRTPEPTSTDLWTDPSIEPPAPQEPLPPIASPEEQAIERARAGVDLDSLMSIRPTASESTSTTAKAPDATEKQLVETVKKSEQKQKADDADYLRTIANNEAVFSQPPPQQTDPAALAPPIDPRKDKIMRDYMESEDAMFTMQDIQQRKDAGAWGVPEQTNLEKQALSYQADKLNQRLAKLMQTSDRMQLDKRRDDIDQRTSALRQEAEQMMKVREMVDPNSREAVESYNAALSDFQSRLNALQADRAAFEAETGPLMKEQQEVAAGFEFIKGYAPKLLLRAASTPEMKEAATDQAMANMRRAEIDKKMDRGRHLFGKGGGTFTERLMNSTEAFDEYIVRPIGREILHLGGNATAFVARRLDDVGNLPATLTDGQRLYSPAAQYADHVAKSVERLTWTEPTMDKQELFDKEWRVNPAWLPKLAKGAVYMGAVQAAGAAGGVPAMMGASVALMSEDYYQEGMQEGLKPVEAERFALMMGMWEGIVEQFNKGPFVKDSGIRRELARKAVKAVKSGKTMNHALDELMGYSLKQGVWEGAEEIATGIGQAHTKYLTNLAFGSKFEVIPTLQQTAEEFLMGFALGGLMGGSSRISTRPAFKEALTWATSTEQNQQAVRDYIAESAGNEQEKAKLNDQFDTYVRVAKGLDAIGVEEQVREDLLALSVEKEQLLKEQKDTYFDPQVEAAYGEEINGRIKEIDNEIAAILKLAKPGYVPGGPTAQASEERQRKMSSFVQPSQADEAATQADTEDAGTVGEVQPQEQEADLQQEQPEAATQELVDDAGTTDTEPALERTDEPGEEATQEAPAQTNTEATATETVAVDGAENLGGVDQGQEEALTEDELNYTAALEQGKRLFLADEQGSDVMTELESAQDIREAGALGDIEIVDPADVPANANIQTWSQQKRKRQPAQQQEQTPEQRRVESGGFIVTEDADGNVVVEKSANFKEPKVKASKHRNAAAARRNSIRTRRTRAIREFDEKYGTSHAPSTNAIKEQRKRQQAVAAKMEERGKLSADDIALKMIGVEGVRVSSESVRAEMYPDQEDGKLATEHLNLRRLKIAVDQSKATRDNPVYSIEALAERMVANYGEQVQSAPNQLEDNEAPFDIQEARQAIISALNIGSRSKALEELEDRYGLNSEPSPIPGRTMAELEQEARAAGVDIDTIIESYDEANAEEDDADQGAAGTEGPGMGSDEGDRGGEEGGGLDEGLTDDDLPPPFQRTAADNTASAAVEELVARVQQAFPNIDVVADQAEYDAALAEAGTMAVRQAEADPERAKLVLAVQSAQRALRNAEKDFNDRGMDLFSTEQQTALDTGADASQENFDRITKPLRTAVEQARKKLDDYDRNKGIAESQQTTLFSTKDGTTLGFVYNGKVYLNPSAVKADTPVHEGAHIWMQLARQTNPALHQQGLTLAKKSPYYQEAKESPEYAHLNEDQLADEALAMAMRDAGKRIQDRSAWKQWSRRFWRWVKGQLAKMGINIGGINLETATFEQFADAVAEDLLSGRPVSTITSEQLDKAIREGASSGIHVEATISKESNLATDKRAKPLRWAKAWLTRTQGSPKVWKSVREMEGREAANAKRAKLYELDLLQAIREAVNAEGSTKSGKNAIATKYATMVHEFLQGKVGADAMPPAMAHAATQFRSAIDDFTKALIEEGGAVDGFEAGLSQNLHFYLKARSEEADTQEKYEKEAKRKLDKVLAEVAQMPRQQLLGRADSNEGRIAGGKRRLLARKKRDLENQIKALQFAASLSMAPEYRKLLRKLKGLIDRGGRVDNKSQKEKDEAAAAIQQEIEALQEEVMLLQQEKRPLTEEEVDLVRQIEEAKEILSEMGTRDAEAMNIYELAQHVQRQEQSLYRMDLAVRRANNMDMAPRYVEWVTDPDSGNSTITIFHVNGEQTKFEQVTLAQKKALFGGAISDKMIAQEEGSFEPKKQELLTGSRLYQSMMANMGVYVTRGYRAFLDADNWQKNFRAIIGEDKMRQIEGYVRDRLANEEIAGYRIITTAGGHAVRFINSAGFESQRSYSADRIEEKFRKSGVMNDDMLDAILGKIKAGDTGRHMLATATLPVRQGLVDFRDAVTEADVQQFIREVTSAGGFQKVLSGQAVGKVETGIFMRKKDIEEPMRALLGEVTDGRVSLPMTLLKMGNALSQRAMAMRILQDGMGTSFSEQPTKFHTVPLTKEQLSVLQPGETIYATEEAAFVLKPLLRMSKDANMVYSVMAAIATFSKVNLTVLNPESQARNFNSVPWQVWMTGTMLNPLTMKQGWQDFKLALSALTQTWTQHQTNMTAVYNMPAYAARRLIGKSWGHHGRDGKGNYSKEHMREMFLKFVELQGGQQGAQIGELERLLKESQPFVDKYGIDAAVNRTQLGKLTKKFTMDAATPAYALSDELPKFLVWLNETRTLQKAYPDWSKERAMAEAMNITLRTTWTYGNNPLLFQELSKMPVLGAFINWRVATWKAMGSNIARAKEELSSGNDVLRARGAKRAAGIMLTNVLVEGAALAALMYLGWDDDDVDAFSDNQPEYEQNNQKIFVPWWTSNKDHTYSFLDLTYMVPQAQYMMPFTVFAASRRKGASVADAAWDVFVSELTNYTAFEPWLKSTYEAIKIYEETDDIWRSMTPLQKTLLPGVLHSYHNLYRAAQGEQRLMGDQVIGEYSILEQLSNMLIGTRVRNRDPLAVGTGRVRHAATMMTKQRTQFLDWERKFKELPARKQTEEAKVELQREYYERYNPKWQEHFRQAAASYRGLLKLQYTEQQIREEAKKMGTPEWMVDAALGGTLPYMGYLPSDARAGGRSRRPSKPGRSRTQSKSWAPEPPPFLETQPTE